MDIEAYREQYSKKKWQSLKALAVEFRELEDEIQAAESALSMLKDRYDFLRKILVPEMMEAQGVSNITLKMETGRVRFQLAGDMYINTPSENRGLLQEWLIKHNAADLIQPTVNGSTLKAFIKEQIANGAEVPEGIVKIEPFTRASLVKVPD